MIEPYDICDVPLMSAIDNEYAERCKSVLNHMDRQYKDLLILRYYYGLSDEAMAALLHIPENVVTLKVQIGLEKVSNEGCEKMPKQLSIDKSVNNKMNEAILYSLGHLYCDMLCEEADLTKEYFDDVEPPLEITQLFEGFIRKEKRITKGVAIGKKMMSSVRVVFAVGVIIALLLGMAMNVEAIKIPVMNMVLDAQETYMRVSNIPQPNRGASALVIIHGMSGHCRTLARRQKNIK